MNVEPHFIDWKEPALPAFADFLLQHFSVGNECDLSPWLIVVPGARAGRRLLEVLALKAQRCGAENAPLLLVPPRIITPGQLPEALLKPEHERALASEEEMLFARMAALRATDSGLLQQVFATLPASEDVLGWCSIAEELEALHDELAGENISHSDVEKYCIERNLNACARWRILSQIAEKTDVLLAQSGRISRREARRQALQNGHLRDDLSIILFSTIDLNTVTRSLLEASGSRVLTVVHAPQSETDGFGEFGQIVPEYWEQKFLEFKEDEIRIATHAGEQAAEVAEFLGALRGVEDDAITIGLGEETLGVGIARAIENCGRRARQGAAVTLAQSSLAELLRVLAAFWSDPRPEHFAALLSHPDFGAWLRHARIIAPETSLLTTWDKYFAEHLPPLIHEHSACMPTIIGRVLRALRDLEPQDTKIATTRQPLAHWTQPIGQLLEAIYGGQEYSLKRETQMFQALQLFGTLLQQFAASDASTSYAPRFSWCEALRWLLKLAASTPLPPPAGEAAVELVGWLEVHLDDAPVLLITSLNESLIPDSSFAAPFLTEGLRHHFGLTDNRRRYARDAYLLAATRSSRRKFEVVCSRRSALNEPLQPSRLLFACDAATAARRAREFFTEDETPAARPLFLQAGTRNRLAHFARPKPLKAPLCELRVTAFRDYLACPYRFYLKHICGLEAVGEAASEMNGALFGSLLHEVLRDFGSWIVEERKGASQPAADEIFAKSAELLQRAAHRQFGRERLASVEMQLYQIERRLHAFARAQAEQAADGWQVLCVESKLEKYFNVGSAPFRVYGRTDRIDYHPELNAFRVLDYKTGDSKKTPEQTHRSGGKGEKIWCDLQLPLYRQLVPSCAALAEKELEDARIEVGYFCLPPQLDQCGVEMAVWDESDFGEATARATEVMSALQQQIYWPPGAAPRFDDGLAALCFDSNRERAALVAASVGAENSDADQDQILWPFWSGNASTPALGGVA